MSGHHASLLRMRRPFDLAGSSAIAILVTLALSAPVMVRT